MDTVIILIYIKYDIEVKRTLLRKKIILLLFEIKVKRMVKSIRSEAVLKTVSQKMK